MADGKVFMLILWLICAFNLALMGALAVQIDGIEDLTGRMDLTPEDISPLLRLNVRGTPAIAMTVLFASNSARPSPESMQNLNSLGRVLASGEFSRDRFQIVGHTDSIGSDRANQRLSERRANSVKRYLVRNFQISPERLATEGRGESEPVPGADDNTSEGRQKNRRVVIMNLGTK